MVEGGDGFVCLFFGSLLFGLREKIGMLGIFVYIVSGVYLCCGRIFLVNIAFDFYLCIWLLWSSCCVFGLVLDVREEEYMYEDWVCF